jgi:hypothetical protein
METSTGSSAATANGRFTVDAEKARRLEARMMGGGTMGDEENSRNTSIGFPSGENSRAEMEQVVSPAAFPLPCAPGSASPPPAPLLDDRAHTLGASTLHSRSQDTDAAGGGLNKRKFTAEEDDKIVQVGRRC